MNIYELIDSFSMSFRTYFDELFNWQEFIVILDINENTIGRYVIVISDKSLRSK